MSNRYFFGKDSDGHDYLIPLSMRAQWEAMTESDIDDEDYDAQDAFENVFGYMRTTMGYSSFSFSNPQEI